MSDLNAQREELIATNASLEDRTDFLETLNGKHVAEIKKLQYKNKEDCDTLNKLKPKCLELQQQNEKLQQEISSLQEKVDYYKNKGEDCFSAATHRRSEELRYLRLHRFYCEYFFFAAPFPILELFRTYAVRTNLYPAHTAFVNYYNTSQWPPNNPDDFPTRDTATFTYIDPCLEFQPFRLSESEELSRDRLLDTASGRVQYPKYFGTRPCNCFFGPTEQWDYSVWVKYYDLRTDLQKVNIDISSIMNTLLDNTRTQLISTCKLLECINKSNNNNYNNNNNNSNNNNKPYNVQDEVQRLFKPAENNNNKDKAYCNIQRNYDVNKPAGKYLEERQRNRNYDARKRRADDM